VEAIKNGYARISKRYGQISIGGIQSWIINGRINWKLYMLDIQPKIVDEFNNSLYVN